jgi:AGZA family xanthine/uracil permease-like MFS transporter
MGSRLKLWVPGDWNALFGFGMNILVNVLVLTGLLRFVLKMPDQVVFGRILPALGVMLFLSTGYYAFLAYRLARKTGRTDVCALPSGVSVPHMFVVTFIVMLPIELATKDPVQAWWWAGSSAPSSAASRRAPHSSDRSPASPLPSFP